MKKRIAKKVAKRYIDGGSISRYVRGLDEYPTGQGGWGAQVVLAKGLTGAVLSEAARRGWDGYWADSPILVYHDDADNSVVGWAAGCSKSVTWMTGYSLSDRYAGRVQSRGRGN